MEDLFRAIRENAGPTVWSKGVELARQDAVTGDSETPEEIRFRVANANGISAAVSLFPLDEDWQCSCHEPSDPCPHVAAAVIALKRAREQGQALPRSKSAAGKLLYRFARTPEGLRLERIVAHADAETPLTVALSAISSGRVAGPSLAATAEDMQVDLAMDGYRHGLLPPAKVRDLFKALARGLSLSLDGQTVTVSEEPIGIVCEIRDEGPGVHLRGVQDPAIRETFANQIALCDGDILRPIQIPTLTPIEQQIIREGRFFGPREYTFLVSEILPGLEAKLPLRIQTTRLPGKSQARPTLAVDLIDAGGGLEVTPYIAYGDPPIAEVRGGLMYHKGADVPVRDLDEERRLRDQLWQQHRLVLGESARFTPEDAIRLVATLRDAPELKTQGSGLAAFTHHGTLTPDVTIGSVELSATFHIGDKKRADAAVVLKAWRDGQALVPLLDGGYAELPKDWLDRYGPRLLDLLAARDESGRIATAARPELAELADELDLAVPEALQDLRQRLQQEPPPYVLPSDLKAELRVYQRQGIDWLASLRRLELGGLLCDDMGLGKTLMAIAILEKGSLVVAPTSVLHNWLKELARFRPALRVAPYYGAGRTFDDTADVTITTYTILRMDTAALSSRHWKVVVLDEAQAIKNPDSRVTQAAHRLRADFRVALSGTPVENRLQDLWSQMQFANPGLLGDRRRFDESFARPIAQGDQDAATRLRRRIRPFVLRRLKREVAPELPPRIDVVKHVELSAPEREIYEALRLATRRDILAKLEAGGSVIEALEALLRLRQACCHPDLLPGHDGLASSKLNLLIDLLGEATAEEHKALVFSQWTRYLDLMEPALQTAGIPYLRLDGSTVDRAGVVQAFQAEDGPPVLLMSLKAGGVGLNLTAADHVIITDPWWNPAAEDQAADRAHRLGQERPVLVQRLVAMDSVEERILALQEAKRALAAAALGGGRAGGSVTRDELLALLA